MELLRKFMTNNEKIEELNGSNILVTGGCGFIGSEVTKQLSRIGANITILDNLSSGKEEYIKEIPNADLVVGELNDAEKIKQVVKEKDYIINLAALPFIPDSYYYPMKFFDVNVNATIGIALEAIKENKIKRFTHISSSEIYGSARYTPMDEEHPTTPQSTYAVSKLAGERVIFTMHKEHELPAVIIRPFNTYGPNITQPYIIPEIINQILSGKEEVILGNVKSERDLTYVSDTARSIILSLTAENVIGETINVGTKSSHSVEKLVNIISKIMNKDVTIKIDSKRFRPYDVQKLVCGNEKAKKLLQWKPDVSIEEGLKNTIEWAKKSGININIDTSSGWPSDYRRGFQNNN